MQARPLLCTLALLGTTLGHAIADNAPGQSADNRSTAALDLLRSHLSQAQTLRLTSKVTLISRVAAQKSLPEEYTVQGLLQRPRNFRFEISRGGHLIRLLVCDGNSMFDFDPAARRYRRFDKGANGKIGLSLSGPAFYPIPDLLLFDLRPSEAAADVSPLDGYFFLAPLNKLALSASEKGSQDKPVLTITGGPTTQQVPDGKGNMTDVTLAVVLSLGRKTGLPISLNQSEGTAGPKPFQFERDERYSRFQLSREASQKSPFVWTPPPGATQDPHLDGDGP